MSTISLELVPREEEKLIKELQVIKEKYPEISAINIPDLLRFDTRSWDGCVTSKKLFNRSIPHIRAIDVNPDKVLHMKDTLKDNNINEVLVIAGDPPVNFSI